MEVTVTEVEYSPLPTEEMLDFEITKQETQPNYFDKSKTVINVEFSLKTPGLDRRKVWANYGPYWPRVDSTKTTKFFELVKAVDPANAIKGQGYDSENLVGKVGRLVMVDYTAKSVDEDGKPVIKQKIKDVFGPSKLAATVTAEPVTAPAGKTVKF